jgi:hypothetical protein
MQWEEGGRDAAAMSESLWADLGSTAELYQGREAEARLPRLPAAAAASSKVLALLKIVLLSVC